ncbi:hypothetical protein D3C81_2165130 [compost metagenome]
MEFQIQLRLELHDPLRRLHYHFVVPALLQPAFVAVGPQLISLCLLEHVRAGIGR